MMNGTVSNELNELFFTADNSYYTKKMRTIIDSFPNKGPPSTPTRLLYHLYIGSMRNAEDHVLLQRLGITHVMNCAGTRKFDLKRSPYPKEVGVQEYLMISAEDHEDYNIMQHFQDAVDFIDSAKKSKGRALVHCNLGVNRSGTICAAYIMMEQHKCLLEVTNFLKMKRAVVLCNKNFRKQLVKFARIKGLLDKIPKHEANVPGESKNKPMRQRSGSDSFTRDRTRDRKDSLTRPVLTNSERDLRNKNNHPTEFTRQNAIDGTLEKSNGHGILRTKLRFSLPLVKGEPVSSRSFTRSSDQPTDTNRSRKGNRPKRRAHTAPLPSLQRPLQLSTSPIVRPASFSYFDDDTFGDEDDDDDDDDYYPTGLGTLYEDFEDLSLNPGRMFGTLQRSVSRQSSRIKFPGSRSSSAPPKIVEKLVSKASMDSRSDKFGGSIRTKSLERTHKRSSSQSSVANLLSGSNASPSRDILPFDKSRGFQQSPYTNRSYRMKQTYNGSSPYDDLDDDTYNGFDTLPLPSRTPRRNPAHTGSHLSPRLQRTTLEF